MWDMVCTLNIPPSPIRTAKAAEIASQPTTLVKATSTTLARGVAQRSSRSAPGGIEHNAAGGAAAPSRARPPRPSLPDSRVLPRAPQQAIPTRSRSSVTKPPEEVKVPRARNASVTRDVAPPRRLSAPVSVRDHATLVDRPAGKFTWVFPYNDATDALAHELSNAGSATEPVLRKIIADIRSRDAKLLPAMREFQELYASPKVL